MAIINQIKTSNSNTFDINDKRLPAGDDIFIDLEDSMMGVEAGSGISLATSTTTGNLVISASGGETFIVDFSFNDGGNLVSNKTFAQIKAAVDAGNAVQGRFATADVNGWLMMTCSCNNSTSGERGGFKFYTSNDNFIADGHGWFIIEVKNTGSGDEVSYTYIPFNPDSKESTMTQAVGIDDDGKLWTAASSGGISAVTVTGSGNAVTTASISGSTLTLTKGNTFATTDTKNTTGSSAKTGTKMYLVGATAQSANTVTYSNVNNYIGTDNCLYSGGTKVLTAHQSLDACEKTANRKNSFSDATGVTTNYPSTYGVVEYVNTKLNALTIPDPPILVAFTLTSGGTVNANYTPAQVKAYMTAGRVVLGSYNPTVMNPAGTVVPYQPMQLVPAGNGKQPGLLGSYNTANPPTTTSQQFHTLIYATSDTTWLAGSGGY